MSSNWNDPEMNLAGLRLYYEQALKGGPDKLAQFAALSWGWAAKADAHIERIEQKRGQKARRELAEKILLKLIEIGTTAFALDPIPEGPMPPQPSMAQLAWSIADAFLKAEGGE